MVGTAAYKFLGCRQSQGFTESTWGSMSNSLRTEIPLTNSSCFQPSPITSHTINSALTELEKGVLDLQADGSEKPLTIMHPEPEPSNEEQETKFQKALI